ncbi:hypothetical protein Tco_0388981 [Tanacetum coccineum]
MAASSSSSSSNGSMTLTQYSAYLKPSRVDLVKLHKEKLTGRVLPDDNMYVDLPNEKSAIVTLKCMDEKLVDKEQKVKEEEVQLAALRQERLTYIFIGDEDSLKEVDKKIRNLEKKLTKKKAELKLKKEEARTTEQNNVELKQAKEEARTTEQNNVELKQAKEEARTTEQNNVELKQAKEEARTTEHNNATGWGWFVWLTLILKLLLLLPLPLRLMKSGEESMGHQRSKSRDPRK